MYLNIQKRNVMKKFNPLLVSFFVIWVFPLSAGTVEEKFKIEGLISPASPKALQTEVEKELSVKFLDLELTTTPSGWPELTLQYDSSSVSKEEVEETIANIEDPAGHNYNVHKGPLQANAGLTEEEMQSIAMLGPTAAAFPQITNPYSDDSNSAARGGELFIKNLSLIHI